MSNIIEGYLSEVDSKSGTTKKGRQYTSYRGKINDAWYSFGFEKPSVNKGDYVRAELGETNGYTQVMRAERIEAPASAPTQTTGDKPRSRQAGNSGSQFSQQSSIHLQNSRTAALTMVNILISQDALPVSAAKTSAGKAKRYEEISALVDKLTVRYFYDLETQRLTQTVADEGAEGTKPEALPEDKQEAAEDDVPGIEGQW